MIMYTFKSEEGYLRITGDGLAQITSLEKASVYTDEAKCMELYRLLKQMSATSDLRLVRLTINEEDYFHF